MCSLWCVPQAGCIIVSRPCSAVCMLLPLLSSCRFTHLHWTLMVKDSWRMGKCLLGIFCLEWVEDVVLGCLPYFLRNMWGFMCWTGHFFIYQLGFVSFLLCRLTMGANNRVHHGSMAVFVCLHITLPNYHHADASEGIEHQNASKFILSTVCLRLNQFSQLSFMK